MALCKVARVQCIIWSFARRSRGFCQKAEVVHEPWTNLIASVGEQVAGDQKALPPLWVAQQIMAAVKAEKEALVANLGDLKVQLEWMNSQLEQKDSQLKQKDLQLERKDSQLEQKDLQLERKGSQLEQKNLQLERKDSLWGSQVANMEEQINFLKDLRTIAKIKVLQVQGLNNARGLFEMLQEHLAPPSRKGLRGSALWEAILKQHLSLGVCVEGHIKVKAFDFQKQAMHIYHIYTILSNHVHAGKELAALQSNAGGTILFQRGPMSPEEVCIFKCIGNAAGFKLAEDPDTIPQ